MRGFNRYKITDLVSPEYRATLIEMRRLNPHWGNKGFKYATEFMDYFKELGCATLLDYGCGTRTLEELIRKEYSMFCSRVSGYDPSYADDVVPRYTADFLVATDVHEHIELDRLDNVLRHQSDCALRGAYFHIAITKAKRFLPDDRNAHLIVQPAEWWLKQLRQPHLAWQIDKQAVGQKALKVWMRKVFSPQSSPGITSGSMTVSKPDNVEERL